MTDLRTLVKERIATFCPGHLVLKTLNIVIGKSPPGGERIVRKNTHSGSVSTTIQDTSRISIVRKLPTFNTAKLTVRQLSPIEGKYTV